MITFSIPCGLFWFAIGNLTMLIGLLTAALISRARKKKRAVKRRDQPSKTDRSPYVGNNN